MYFCIHSTVGPKIIEEGLFGFSLSRVRTKDRERQHSNYMKFVASPHNISGNASSGRHNFLPNTFDLLNKYHIICLYLLYLQ
jgi:hypothetical protein